MAKVTTDFRKAFKKFDTFRRSSLNALSKKLPDLIVREINGGRSPVTGKRFKGYSKSYKKAIGRGRFSEFGKRKSPVNMRLSGKMLLAVFSRKTGRTLLIGFDSEIAEFHNEGAGNLPKRKLLPTGKETFSNSINQDADVILKKVAKRIFTNNK